MAQKMPSRNVILLNGAAALIALTSVAVAFRSTFFPPQMTPCRDRFHTAIRFSLGSEGALKTIEEVQAQAASSDWGLLDGARIVKLRSGPSTHAIEVDLATAPAATQGTAEQRAGVGFQWTPPTIPRPTAACLTYSVFLPEGFTFGKGGRLPGLEWSAPPAEGEEQRPPEYSMRYVWDVNGEMDSYPVTPDWPVGYTMDGRRRNFVLAPGRWTELEQEVIMNTPGKENGILRVWMNGTLVYERTDIEMRKTDTTGVTGVLAEAVAGDVPTGANRGPQKIWITPFEVRWQ